MCLHYQDNELYIEDVSLKSIANTYGTPCYVYSQTTLENNWRAFDTALRGHPHRICYAVKANSNLAILNLLAKLNSGFDIVSGGELERVLAASGNAANIIFSGVGKKRDEIELAISKGIYCFNVESIPELERLQDIAQAMQTPINIALRINPGVDALTHSYISTGLSENKFGIDRDEIIPLCQKIAGQANLHLIGIAVHIGSQIVSLNPFALALDHLVSLYQQITALGFKLQHINIGGGLGITYQNEQPPTINDYAQLILRKLANCPMEIIVEPGRTIVGNAGVLLTRVEYLKHNETKNFAIVDAGMNDLIRPALYGAWQDILPVEKRLGAPKQYDIAGPVCESADFLGKERMLLLQQDDLLAINSAGAYGFSMASNYNSRCRAPEVLVDKSKLMLIRRRETLIDLFATENLMG